MKIIYVTTTMDESDYIAFATQWSIPLNPSKQTFHHKLIKALSVDNEIDVISIRPFSRKYCSIYYLDRATNKKDKINWHYLAIPRYKAFKYPACKSQTLDMLKTMDLKDTIVLTETINPIALHVANAIKETYKLPVIGIVTESPSNIGNTTRKFSVGIFKKGRNFDGYIAMTSGLNTVFNPDSKPNLILEGIVEDELPPQIPNEFGRYIFFGGSLQDKYGIYELIEAFKNIEDPSLRLLICGHHADNERLAKAIDSDQRILNLGILSNKKTIQLEMNALANVDPRPFSEDLDRFSIPTKTYRYIFFGGSLQDKYGIYELIEAFKNIEDPSLRLLICGHHADNERLAKAIDSDQRILNLGILSNKKTIQLEMNALANVDPRPFSEDLDRFSIPTKTYEYMNSGVITISVKNSKLKKYFSDNLIWCKSGDTAELYEAMKKVLSLSEEERKEFGRLAKEKVQELYSQTNIAKSVNSFLEQFKKD